MSSRTPAFRHGCIRLCLFCLFCITGGMLLPGLAGARDAGHTISPVCAEKDFNAFLERYVLVSKEEQASCIRFGDFVYRGQMLGSPTAFLQSEAAGTKLMFSRQDIAAEGEADFKFFYPMTTDMVRNGPAFNHYCYIIREEGDKRFVSLTSGGTFALETLGFEWDGSHWRLISIITEDMQ